MVYRIFFYLTGHIMAVSGGISSISYLNLLTMGYDWFGYIHFIFQRPECYFLPVGLLILTISIFFPSSRDKSKME